MIKYESYDDDKLADDLFETVGDDIKDMADVVANYVVAASPVDTGLFKGNWNASINEEYDGSFIHEDPDGAETKVDMKSDIDSFNLKVDKKIFIQNNVKNPDDDFEPYAATVGFDSTQSKAASIISGAAIRAAESKN